MLDEIVNKHSGSLGHTDQLIWKYIYNHKKECATMSIHEVAVACNVSRTTVLRFAQKISLQGFSELKALLRLELKQKQDFGGIKVIEAISSQYQQVMADIQKKDFTLINQLIMKAERIVGYGTGVIQMNVLREMKRLFTGSGEFIYSFEGGAEFDFLSGTLTKNDLLIIVSLSGENPVVLDRLEMLRLKEVPIISITQFEDNTLARASKDNLYISTPKFDVYAGDKHYRYTSMTVFYAVVEILFLQYQLYKHQLENGKETP